MELRKYTIWTFVTALLLVHSTSGWIRFRSPNSRRNFLRQTSLERLQNCAGQPETQCGICGEGPGELRTSTIPKRNYSPINITNNQIDVEVAFRVNLQGSFQFRICNVGPRASENARDCTRSPPLIIGNELEYSPEVGQRYAQLQLQLPAEVTCERCVLQVKYKTGTVAPLTHGFYFDCAPISILKTTSGSRQNLKMVDRSTISQSTMNIVRTDPGNAQVVSAVVRDQPGGERRARLIIRNGKITPKDSIQNTNSRTTVIQTVNTVINGKASSQGDVNVDNSISFTGSGQGIGNPDNQNIRSRRVSSTGNGKEASNTANQSIRSHSVSFNGSGQGTDNGDNQIIRSQGVSFAGSGEGTGKADNQMIRSQRVSFAGNRQGTGNTADQSIRSRRISFVRNGQGTGNTANHSSRSQSASFTGSGPGTGNTDNKLIRFKGVSFIGSGQGNADIQLTRSHGVSLTESGQGTGNADIQLTRSQDASFTGKEQGTGSRDIQLTMSEDASFTGSGQGNGKRDIQLTRSQGTSITGSGQGNGNRDIQPTRSQGTSFTRSGQGNGNRDIQLTRSQGTSFTESGQGNGNADTPNIRSQSVTLTLNGQGGNNVVAKGNTVSTQSRSRTNDKSLVTSRSVTLTVARATRPGASASSIAVATNGDVGIVNQANEGTKFGNDWEVPNEMLSENNTMPIEGNANLKTNIKGTKQYINNTNFFQIDMSKMDSNNDSKLLNNFSENNTNMNSVLIDNTITTFNETSDINTYNESALLSNFSENNTNMNSVFIDNTITTFNETSDINTYNESALLTSFSENNTNMNSVFIDNTITTFNETSDINTYNESALLTSFSENNTNMNSVFIDNTIPTFNKTSVGVNDSYFDNISGPNYIEITSNINNTILRNATLVINNTYVKPQPIDGTIVQERFDFGNDTFFDAGNQTSVINETWLMNDTSSLRPAVPKQKIINVNPMQEIVSVPNNIIIIPIKSETSQPQDVSNKTTATRTYSDVTTESVIVTEPLILRRTPTTFKPIPAISQFTSSSSEIPITFPLDTTAVYSDTTTAGTVNATATATATPKHPSTVTFAFSDGTTVVDGTTSYSYLDSSQTTTEKYPVTSTSNIDPFAYLSSHTTVNAYLPSATTTTDPFAFYDTTTVQATRRTDAAPVETTTDSLTVRGISTQSETSSVGMLDKTTVAKDYNRVYTTDISPTVGTTGAPIWSAETSTTIAEDTTTVITPVSESFTTYTDKYNTFGTVTKQPTISNWDKDTFIDTVTSRTPSDNVVVTKGGKNTIVVDTWDTGRNPADTVTQRIVSVTANDMYVSPSLVTNVTPSSNLDTATKPFTDNTANTLKTVSVTDRTVIPAKESTTASVMFTDTKFTEIINDKIIYNSNVSSMGALDTVMPPLGTTDTNEYRTEVASDTSISSQRQDTPTTTLTNVSSKKHGIVTANNIKPASSNINFLITDLESRTDNIGGIPIPTSGVRNTQSADVTGSFDSSTILRGDTGLSFKDMSNARNNGIRLASSTDNDAFGKIVTMQGTVIGRDVTSKGTTIVRGVDSVLDTIESTSSRDSSLRTGTSSQDSNLRTVTSSSDSNLRTVTSSQDGSITGRGLSQNDIFNLSKFTSQDANLQVSRPSDKSVVRDGDTEFISRGSSMDLTNTFGNELIMTNNVAIEKNIKMQTGFNTVPDSRIPVSETPKETWGSGLVFINNMTNSNIRNTVDQSSSILSKDYKFEDGSQVDSIGKPTGLFPIETKVVDNNMNVVDAVSINGDINNNNNNRLAPTGNLNNNINDADLYKTPDIMPPIFIPKIARAPIAADQSGTQIGADTSNKVSATDFGLINIVNSDSGVNPNFQFFDPNEMSIGGSNVDNILSNAQVGSTTIWKGLGVSGHQGLGKLDPGSVNVVTEPPSSNFQPFDSSINWESVQGMTQDNKWKVDTAGNQGMTQDINNKIDNVGDRLNKTSLGKSAFWNINRMNNDVSKDTKNAPTMNTLKGNSVLANTFTFDQWSINKPDNILVDTGRKRDVRTNRISVNSVDMSSTQDSMPPITVNPLNYTTTVGGIESSIGTRSGNKSAELNLQVLRTLESLVTKLKNSKEIHTAKDDTTAAVIDRSAPQRFREGFVRDRGQRGSTQFRAINMHTNTASSSPVRNIKTVNVSVNSGSKPLFTVHPSLLNLPKDFKYTNYVGNLETRIDSSMGTNDLKLANLQGIREERQWNIGTHNTSELFGNTEMQFNISETTTHGFDSRNDTNKTVDTSINDGSITNMDSKAVKHIEQSVIKLPTESLDISNMYNTLMHAFSDISTGQSNATELDSIYFGQSFDNNTAINETLSNSTHIVELKNTTKPTVSQKIISTNDVHITDPLFTTDNKFVKHSTVQQIIQASEQNIRNPFAGTKKVNHSTDNVLNTIQTGEGHTFRSSGESGRVIGDKIKTSTRDGAQQNTNKTVSEKRYNVAKVKNITNGQVKSVSVDTNTQNPMVVSIKRDEQNQIEANAPMSNLLNQTTNNVFTSSKSNVGKTVFSPIDSMDTIANMSMAEFNTGTSGGINIVTPTGQITADSAMFISQDELLDSIRRKFGINLGTPSQTKPVTTFPGADVSIIPTEIQGLLGNTQDVKDVLISATNGLGGQDINEAVKNTFKRRGFGELDALANNAVGENTFDSNQFGSIQFLTKSMSNPTVASLQEQPQNTTVNVTTNILSMQERNLLPSISPQSQLQALLLQGKRLSNLVPVQTETSISLNTGQSLPNPLPIQTEAPIVHDQQNQLSLQQDISKLLKLRQRLSNSVPLQSETSTFQIQGDRLSKDFSFQPNPKGVPGQLQHRQTSFLPRKELNLGQAQRLSNSLSLQPDPQATVCKRSQRFVCRAIGLLKNVPGMVWWCFSRCKTGVCPEERCKCTCETTPLSIDVTVPRTQQPMNASLRKSITTETENRKQRLKRVINLTLNGSKEAIVPVGETFSGSKLGQIEAILQTGSQIDGRKMGETARQEGYGLNMPMSFTTNRLDISTMAENSNAPKQTTKLMGTTITDLNTLRCRGVKEFVRNKGIDEWCTTMCNRNVCPAEMCAC